MSIGITTPDQRPAAARRSLDVLVVDDHPAVRAGVRAVLEDEPGIGAVAAVATAGDALAHAERHAPAVAVVDYHLPDRDGLALTRQLKALRPAPGVVIFSAYADAALTVAATVAGADGLANKGGRGDELCEAVRAVAAGREAMPPIPPAVMQTMARRLEADDLSIFGMLMHRVAPGEIAETLDITPQWLEARRWAILSRLARPGRRPLRLA
jgi:DNA-binding NarL/FixJ family response regulator